MPITLPIATLVGSAIGGGTALAGMRSQRGAQREANTLESRYNDQALADARAERERQQRLDDENRAYDRAQIEREFGYRSGRDAVSDARFNNERDFTRDQFSSYKQRLSPFADAGSRAVANLGSVVGRSLPAAVPTTGPGPMVRLVSPTGQMGEVPAEHLDHYLKLGAKQV